MHSLPLKSLLGILIASGTAAVHANPSTDALSRAYDLTVQGVICDRDHRADKVKLAACFKGINESTLSWIEDLSRELGATYRGRVNAQQMRETVARAQLDWLKFYRAKCELKRAMIKSEYPAMDTEVLYQNSVHNLTQLRAQDLYSEMQ